MALYLLKCGTCGESKQIIRKSVDMIGSPICKCGGQFERDSIPATSRITETIDNGFMSRRVERLAGVKEMIKDRKKDK